MPIITPETTNFLIAGYAVFFGVFISYIASLVFRWQNLKRDLQSLQDMEKDKNS